MLAEMIMRVKKIIYSFFIITAVVLSSFAGNKEVYAYDLSLYALSAVLIDGDSGRILFEKNAFEKRPMASTTKIMTLIVALENTSDDEIVEVSSYASKMPDVQLNINEGEKYRIYDLYYSLMLESHNDTACAIAEHVGGSVQGFADMMNEKAAELGLENTYFITPNGLDAKDENGVHSTTAAELAQIMKYCVMDSPKNEEFLKITQTRSHSFTDISGSRSFTVSNKNKFLDMMEGAISGKTGFTCDAGYCYVGALERDGKTFIVALLGCGWPNNKNYKWSDTKKLMQYGIDNYSYRKIIDSTYKTGDIEITDGIEKDRISTYIDYDLELLISENEDVEIIETLPHTLEAPVTEGEKVGTLEIYINGHPYAKTYIYASEGVKRIDFKYFLKYTIKSYFLIE